jgi:L-iditol 2-dehydrogenase
MCLAAGAGPVFLVGTAADEKRLQVGRALGAAMAIDAEREDAAGIILDATAGDGAHLVIDAAGPEAAVKLAMETVARNGQITKIGWGPKPVNLSLDPLISKAAALQGSYSHTWRTWEAVLKMMAAGQIRMAPMITHRFTIENWEQAYRLMEEREAVKVVLSPV